MSIRFVKYFISFNRHKFFDAYDNYGFGTSDISGNIDGVTNQLNNQGMSYNPQYSSVGQSYNSTPQQSPTPWRSNTTTPNTYNSQSISYQGMMPNVGKQFMKTANGV